MHAMALRSSAGILLALTLSFACSPQASDGGAKHEATKANEAEQTPPADGDGHANEGDGVAPKQQAMGRVLPDAPIPLGGVLGHGPEEAEKILGAPTETGSRRISCVRFLPERVFFACEQEARQYADKTGKFETLHVEYEDGKAASVSMSGLVGEGEFSPEKALAIVGLELPGEHRSIQPQPDVTVWDYWNTEARLVLDDKQYRVQVSVIDGEWPRSKVEVMLNHPLTDDEKSRIKPVGD